MTRRTTPPPMGEGSLLRLLTGTLLIFVALASALIGFVNLITTLEGGGYGTSRMVVALVVLGFAGACLAGGIATVIWDIAKRYEGAQDSRN